MNLVCFYSCWGGPVTVVLGTYLVFVVIYITHCAIVVSYEGFASDTMFVLVMIQWGLGGGGGRGENDIRIGGKVFDFIDRQE